MHLMDMLNWTVAGLGSGDRQVFTDQALRLYPLKIKLLNTSTYIAEVKYLFYVIH